MPAATAPGTSCKRSSASRASCSQTPGAGRRSASATSPGSAEKGRHGTVASLLAHPTRRDALRVIERPISYKPRSVEEGKKIGLKDAFRAVYCILRYGLIPPRHRKTDPVRQRAHAEP